MHRPCPKIRISIKNDSSAVVRSSNDYKDGEQHKRLNVMIGGLLQIVTAREANFFYPVDEAKTNVSLLEKLTLMLAC